MKISDLKAQGLIILECISGSKAYGLDTPESDTDIKGVYILPKEIYYGLDYIPQVSNESNDEVYYELGRFIELLTVNNPNILELLNSPQDAVLYRHPLMERIRPELFITKLCKDTFGKFAASQIKKARGLNKKILNPMGKERKSVLHFCFVNWQDGTLPLLDFLEKKDWKQEDCGLVNLSHMKHCFGLYHSEHLPYKGIIQHETSNEVSLSSIPKDEVQEAVLYFNKDGYSTYCKEYKAYWEWVDKRNETRYENTKSHGKNYDAKNMMHTFRLLEMALEIGKTGQIKVRRPNRDFLLAIKKGKFDYETLLQQAEQIQHDMEEVYQQSNLPGHPDREVVNRLLYELREEYYEKEKKPL